MAILILEFLKNPAISTDYSAKEWEKLIRQARASNLLGRIYYLLKEKGLISKTPKKAHNHLLSEAIIAERQKEQTLREIYEISKALSGKDIDFIILKGAAYVAMDIQCHLGRIFSDIDILVKKEIVEKVEFGLLIHGWIRTSIDDYDEAYYRQWMHEIPPLRHKERLSVIDLHHNILPLTHLDTPKAEKFKTQIVHLNKTGKVSILADEDLVIHSATHLFTESEYHNGLRDLSDLDLMLNYFKDTDESFMANLVNRSIELGLSKYLFLALRYTNLVLATPIKQPFTEKFISSTGYSQIALRINDFCFENIFFPNHASCRTWRWHLAKAILYIRGHAIRMPLRLLIPHLLHKAFISPYDAWKKNRQSQIV